MFNKLKSKFNNFVSRWKYEKHLIKACNCDTPIHRKVCYVISWVCIVIFLIVWIFSFPSSAAVGDAYTLFAGTYVCTDTPTARFTFNVSANFTFTSNGNTYNYISFTPATNGVTIVYGDTAVYNPGDGWLDDDFKVIVLQSDGKCSNDFSTFFEANYTMQTEPIVPEPVVYTIPSGYYKLAELPSVGVPSVGGFIVNIGHLFEVPCEIFYSSGVVKQYNYFGFVLTNFENSNDFSVDFIVQQLDIGSSVRIANLTAVDGVCTSQFYGGITNLYFGEDIVTDEVSYQLISFMFDSDSAFIPDEPAVPDLPSYNPWGYILEMIIEALKVPLFGYFSVWDIFVTICGIFVLTWLLKLLAGG